MSVYQDALSNHNAAAYEANASFVYSAENTGPVLRLLNAQPGERIFDFGCGTGELTQVISEMVGQLGEVWAVDSSESMLDKARSNTKAHINYMQGDIQNLIPLLDPKLEGTFDAVFSSAVFHWCKAKPEGVLESIQWLLKPGGRLAFEMGGFGNGTGVRAALHEVLRKEGVDPIPLDPWYFPTVPQYSSLLVSQGFQPHDVHLVPRPTALPITGIKGWLSTFARNTFFAGFEGARSDELMSAVEEICRPDAFWSQDQTGMGVKPVSTGMKSGWSIMYVRLRGTAVKI